MIHRWSIICKSSTIDSKSNNLSISNILEKISAEGQTSRKNEKLPPIPINFELISYFTDLHENEEAFDYKFSLIDPKGKVLQEHLNKIKVPDISKNVRIKIEATGLPVTENGRYLFRISTRTQKQGNFEFVGEVPLDVELKVTEEK